jgi:hypothetical protein
MPQLDVKAGVKDIESTLMSAQKTHDNMDAVLRQEFLAMAPGDRRAALTQIDKDRESNPSLPALELTDRGAGDVTVHANNDRSLTSQAQDGWNELQGNVRQQVSDDEKALSKGYHDVVDPIYNFFHNPWERVNN